MRAAERWQYIAQAPAKAWDLLVRGRYTLSYDFMPIDVRGLSKAARLNLVRAGLNLGYRRLRPWNWPVHMQVELTSYCNLRCPVCPVGTKELTREAQALDPLVFERIMQEAGRYLLTVSLWAWGEPLLHPQLERILRIARRYPFASLLSTNGQNLADQRVLDALSREPPTYLIVAIDGLCDETNSRFRRGARLQPALEGVRRLSEWKKESGSSHPILHCRFMAMNHNEHEIPLLHEFASANHFEMVSIRTLSTIGSEESTHRSFVPQDNAFRAYDYAEDDRIRREDFICQYAFSFPTILADGTVVSCCHDYNASSPYGTVSPTTSFADLWFGKSAARVRGLIRDHPQELSFCLSCPYADRPISSCTISGYFLTGTDTGAIQGP